MNEELRLYSFTNFYLSSIQQGIQPGHAQGELMLAASLGDMPNSDLLYDWAENWKTVICLNGGDNKGINEWCGFLSHTDNQFPFAPFFESEDALGGILTSVAIVLPAMIFETAPLLRRLNALPEGVTYTHDKLLNEHRFAWYNNGDTTVRTYNDWQMELMGRMNKCGLAR